MSSNVYYYVYRVIHSYANKYLTLMNKYASLKYN